MGVTATTHATFTSALAEAQDLARQALTAARQSRPVPSLAHVWDALSEWVLPTRAADLVTEVALVRAMIAVTQAQCPDHGSGCRTQIAVALSTLLGLPSLVHDQPWPCCCAHAWHRLVPTTVAGRVLQ